MLGRFALTASSLLAALIVSLPVISHAQEKELIDYREEMRQFVQRISRYGRSQNRSFVVVAKDGLDLLNKIDAVDITITAPARTYMRSIDGVLATGVYFGGIDLDQPVEKEETDRILKITDMAKKNGLQVLIMDYGEKPKTVDTVYRNAHKKGYASFVANAYGLDISSIPRYPRRPYNENPQSVLSLQKVKNFVYLRDSQRFGRQDEFALAMHELNHDLVVVDVYHGRNPLQARAVETLKYKKLGSRRLVLAYVNIGKAASYHYYWNDWKEGSPDFVGVPTTGNPDSYYVKYWDPAWQNIILGGPESFMYGVIRQGFDGVVLDGLDTYRYFEGE